MIRDENECKICVIYREKIKELEELSCTPDERDLINEMKSLYGDGLRAGEYVEKIMGKILGKVDG